MSKVKSRHYPDKPQNKKGSCCPRYEEYPDGGCYCEGGSVGTAEVCQGNPHNCIKTFYRRAASRSGKQINNDEYRPR